MCGSGVRHPKPQWTRVVAQGPRGCYVSGIAARKAPAIGAFLLLAPASPRTDIRNGIAAVHFGIAGRSECAPVTATPTTTASDSAEPAMVHLIDGTYELFRHFYGLRRFTKGTDRPYGAVAGVLHTVLQLIETGGTHIGVATDHVIESFRNDLWPGYKTGAGI